MNIIMNNSHLNSAFVNLPLCYQIPLMIIIIYIRVQLQDIGMFYITDSRSKKKKADLKIEYTIL